uniref:RNA polymerase alpha subunit n=1 Tax=Phyllosiphon coccidium TaxID=1837062 RepID=UPI002410C64A|nr:RNA polymerase alpha subunit [Phyllosiphon coccidium]WDY12755.1 RNA polymerase alpha subunit [Phyllosiphon coccidium]
MKNIVLSCLESRVENNRSLYARFLLAPFEKGNALTVGTALRRALLSQIEGIAIIALDIQGVTHEFCTIAGVRESVLELSLNFQQIVLRNIAELTTAQVGYLQVQGPAVVYANDLKLPLGVECVDPTQYIATLSRDGMLVVKFLVGKSINSTDLKKNNNLLTTKNIRQAKKAFKTTQFKHIKQPKNKSLVGAGKAEAIQTAFQSNVCLQNIIPLDSFCTPVNRANFAIQVDDLSNQDRERLLFEIWTNGSIHPRQAIQSAVMSLIALFSEFRNLIHLDSHSFGIRASMPPQMQTSMSKRLSFLYKSNLDRMSLLSSDLGNLPLSLKTYTFLKQKGIHKLDALLNCSSNTLLQLVNGNKNMFYDIKRCVCALGLQFNDTAAELHKDQIGS